MAAVPLRPPHHRPSNRDRRVLLAVGHATGTLRPAVRPATYKQPLLSTTPRTARAYGRPRSGLHLHLTRPFPNSPPTTFIALGAAFARSLPPSSPSTFPTAPAAARSTAEPANAPMHAACGTGRRPVSGSATKPRTPSTCCGVSVIHSPIAMSEPAPVSTAETAAHNNASAGYRGPRASRGSATRIRKRRRSATSLGVRGSAGEPSYSSAEEMGDGVRGDMVSLGSHGSRQPRDHQHRDSAFPDPLACDGHDAESLTRPANRTNPHHAMPLTRRRSADARPGTGAPVRTCRLRCRQVSLDHVDKARCLGPQEPRHLSHQDITALFPLTPWNLPLRDSRRSFLGKNR